MSIKKKDGTVFKLQGPNPMMGNQDLWNENQYILHNFTSDEEKIHAAPIQPIFERLDDIAAEEIQKPIKETILNPTPNKKIRVEKNRNTIKVMCLPAKTIEITDEI